VHGVVFTQRSDARAFVEFGLERIEAGNEGIAGNASLDSASLYP